MALTAKERWIIETACKRLEGDGGSTEEIKELLANPRLRSWMDTWILPALRIVASDKPERPRNRRQSLDFARSLIR